MFLRPKRRLENGENSISENLNFLGWGGACPQTPLGSLRLWRSKSRLPPTFPVGTCTLKLIDSTESGIRLYSSMKLWCKLVVNKCCFFHYRKQIMAGEKSLLIFHLKSGVYTVKCFYFKLGSNFNTDSFWRAPLHLLFSLFKIVNNIFFALVW